MTNDIPADPQSAADQDGQTGLEKDIPEVREAMDASDSEQLRRNPSSEDAKLEVALDETFPGSDAPSNTQPGKGKDPAPSTGYDPEVEGHPS